MTYYGIVLLVAGFQADEARIIKQYDRMLTKYVVLANIRSTSESEYFTMVMIGWKQSIRTVHYGS